jgi:hypothetical protein
VFAELSKIAAAVTVAKSCQPLPSDIHSAEPCSAAHDQAKRGEDSAVTQTSASDKGWRPNNVHIPTARPGQAVSPAEVFSSLDSEALASDSLGVGTQDGLSAVDSVAVVKVDLAQDAAPAVHDGQSVSKREAPVQHSAPRRYPQVIALPDPQLAGKMSDGTRRSVSVYPVSIAGAADGSAKAWTQLPRLASRAPDLRVCTSDREVQLKHHNGHGRTASPEKPRLC